MKKVSKVEQIMNLDIKDVNKMTTKELKANVQILASAANKRLARLAAKPIGQLSLAYISAMKRSYETSKGGKFGTEGKTRNQLLNEFKSTKRFLSMKTSTLKGWAAYRKRTYAGMNMKLNEDPEAEKRFWSIYRKIAEIYPNLPKKDTEGYNSSTVQADLRNVMENDYKAILDEINNNNLQDRETLIGESGETYHTENVRDDISGGKYLVDEGGVVHAINLDDDADVLKIMEQKVNIEYERNQAKQPEGEFYELENK